LDLCRQAARDRKMILVNDGASYRDILSFSDAIDAVRRLSAQVVTPYRLFNLAAGRAITFRTLAETVGASIPGGVEIIFGNGTDNYRETFNIDISRLASLGWKPNECLAGEVTETLAMFRLES
jgi:nucleoside-diphosphate-sugar epimerase